MNEHRTVCSDRGDKSPLHKINDHGCQACLNDVAADAPDYWLSEFARALHASSKLTEALHGENIRQTRQKNLKCRIRFDRTGKVFERYLTRSPCQGIGLHFRQTQRLKIISVNRWQGLLAPTSVHV